MDSRGYTKWTAKNVRWVIDWFLNYASWMTIFVVLNLDAFDFPPFFDFSLALCRVRASLSGI